MNKAISNHHKYVFYFSRGYQYYISGRFAHLSGFIQIGPILFHHAIEFFLKGNLLEKNIFSEKELWEESGHNLEKLWREIEDISLEDSQNFDQFIKYLNKWEDIRYPPNYGHSMMLGIKKEVGSLQKAKSQKNDNEYTLLLEDVDCFVKYIFQKSSVNINFFKVPFKEDVQKYYKKDNLHQFDIGK